MTLQSYGLYPSVHEFYLIPHDGMVTPWDTINECISQYTLPPGKIRIDLLKSKTSDTDLIYVGPMGFKDFLGTQCPTEMLWDFVNKPETKEHVNRWFFKDNWVFVEALLEVGDDPSHPGEKIGQCRVMDYNTWVAEVSIEQESLAPEVTAGQILKDKLLAIPTLKELMPGPIIDGEWDRTIRFHLEKLISCKNEVIDIILQHEDED